MNYRNYLHVIVYNGKTVGDFIRFMAYGDYFQFEWHQHGVGRSLSAVQCTLALAAILDYDVW